MIKPAPYQSTITKGTDRARHGQTRDRESGLPTSLVCDQHPDEVDAPGLFVSFEKPARGAKRPKVAQSRLAFPAEIAGNALVKTATKTETGGALPEARKHSTSFVGDFALIVLGFCGDGRA